MSRYEDVLLKLKRHNQEQLLNFYNELDEKEKADLLNQIDKINLEQVDELYAHRKDIPDANKKIENIPVVKKEKLSDVEKEEYSKIGEKIIKDKRIAVCQMAGGQGTRLGHNGPKGTLIVDKINPPKSIFELFADKLKKTYEICGVKVRWYVMTSNANDAETRKFFEDNNYFDYGKENVKFFVQGELPLLDENGKVVLKEKGKVFMAPDGNGGIYEALRKNEILDEMKKDGIDYLGIGNVDNILINMLDTIFIGLMVKNNYELATKTTTKVSPEEKVGVVCLMDGKPGVVEYTEITEEMANERDEEGELLFGEGYFGCSIFSRTLLERITDKLYFHAAFKKNEYILPNGEISLSDVPNTYKFEAFIFEGFNVSKNLLVLSVNRKDEFAPIKNREGVDSVETAAALYNEFINRS